MGKINPLAPCKKYGVSLWQCPQFLFLVLGMIVIGVILATYFLATLRIDDPSIVTLIVLCAGAILLAIDYIIVNSFERMASASRMKTEFIGIVSHQLRSPLTNLRFSLDILMSGKVGTVGEAELEYYKILKENTQRMGDLVNDLLTVSRIETGELPLAKEEVSLEDITKDLILKFRPFAEASNVKIVLRAEKNLPNILADPLWMEQIIENLLDNAIRYTKGRGEVRIGLKKMKERLYFEVKDTGVGIPKEEQKYIFQKFFRSKNVVRHQTEGSGLGLHISKRLIELLGGKIGFFSQEHKGSTFWFTLPGAKWVKLRGKTR